ncbi:hypothetical protein GCM10007276_14280 [Agaricicola taiwanensis]|uniref:DUF6538 domain-containing protein n=1 Tax=Agaricicola taiwanensis TaxID=591372 RepID=A0A8J2VPI9_9RHOB|nr:DUF6538 domain-containing protein [Agaricicola taiwanensis]GGE37979.1 hypothetical protein GCM10007276_14280 [Agaricicola taiwanensis]
MALNTYLKRRGSIYYARMVVPTDLRAIIDKNELAESLGTRDQREAKCLLGRSGRPGSDFDEFVLGGKSALLKVIH